MLLRFDDTNPSKVGILQRWGFRVVQGLHAAALW